MKLKNGYLYRLHSNPRITYKVIRAEEDSFMLDSEKAGTTQMCYSQSITSKFCDYSPDEGKTWLNHTTEEVSSINPNDPQYDKVGDPMKWYDALVLAAIFPFCLAFMIFSVVLVVLTWPLEKLIDKSGGTFRRVLS